MSDEYTLETDDQEVEPIDVDETATFTDEEKVLLGKIESLTNELADAGVTCFVASKFNSQENPSAAWHFGTDPNEAITAFAKDYAPLFIHITSKFTGTKIVASNEQTGKTVYEVSPQTASVDDEGHAVEYSE